MSNIKAIKTFRDEPNENYIIQIKTMHYPRGEKAHAEQAEIPTLPSWIVAIEIYWKFIMNDDSTTEIQTCRLLRITVSHNLKILIHGRSVKTSEERLRRTLGGIQSWSGDKILSCWTVLQKRHVAEDQIEGRHRGSRWSSTLHLGIHSRRDVDVGVVSSATRWCRFRWPYFCARHVLGIPEG